MTRSMLVLALATVASAAISCHDGSGGFLQSDFPHCINPAPGIFVYSGMSSDGEYLKLGLFAENHTNAWSGIAFAGNGGMKGASQIVVRQEAGKWVAEDRHSLDYVVPSMDDSQDATLVWAEDDGKSISWSVLVRNTSCDADDYPVEDASRYYLWALGSSHAFVQHAANKRGQFHANLVAGTPAPAPLTGVSYVDIHMPNIEVKAAPTANDPTNPYICGMFDLQKLIPATNFSVAGAKVHIAEFTGSVEESSSPYVHHIVLYGCTAAAAAANNFTHEGLKEDCESMPPGCQGFKWAWAVGALPIVFPDNVGMPLGESSETWVALQMHYYNPALDTVRDSSGVRMAVTATLRPVDAAVFTFNSGASPVQRDPLPPQTRSIILEPHWAPAYCSNTWRAPLNVMGVAHHMHLTGVQLQIEVKRGGESLGLMRNERVYDFRHQTTEEPRIKTLLPGDELRLQCEYNTMAKTDPTVFGESTFNEMCFTAFIFYPAQAFRTSTFQRLNLPAVQNLSTMCTTAADAPYDTVSGCATRYQADILAFWGMGTTQGAPTHLVCNTQYAAMMARGPLCPPCGQSANCTALDIVTFAQAAICPTVCHDQFDLSVFPDTSDTTPIYPTHRGACGGVGRDLLTRPVMPAQAPCLESAEFNTTASNALVAALRSARPTGAPTPAVTMAPTKGAASDGVATSANYFFLVALGVLAMLF